MSAILLLLLIGGVSAGLNPASGSAEEMSATTPSFPLSSTIFGQFIAEEKIGYPLAAHPFRSMTTEEVIQAHGHKNQTISLFPYHNPPLFPGETVYGYYHEGLGYVSWLKEFTDTDGTVRLCQVADTGEFGERPYLRNLTPAENDYLGLIEWFIVDGKIWPRTWINGSMYEGQRWAEWWGPFTVDEQGSVFRYREAVVTRGTMDIGGDQAEVYVVTYTGPSEQSPGIFSTEKFLFADGIGAVGRDFIEETTEEYPLRDLPGLPADAPASLPPGTRIMEHTTRCVAVSPGITSARIPT